jgi:hypothetical protein
MINNQFFIKLILKCIFYIYTYFIKKNEAQTKFNTKILDKLKFNLKKTN